MYPLLLKLLVLVALSGRILVLGSELVPVTIEVSDNDDSSLDSAHYCPDDVVCRSETEYIQDVTINPVQWTLNKPVTFSFRITHKSIRWRIVNLAVHHVLDREESDVPRHVFKGFILRGNPQLEVGPGKRYKATFVPPYFWKSGKYLLTLSLMKRARDWEATKPGGMKGWNTFEQEFVVQAAAEADVSFDRVGLLPFPIESVPTGFNYRDDRDTTELELDVFRLILPKFRSATEVCNFCQSFSSARKKCKIIFDTAAHPHKKTLSDVSLQQICSIGALESRLHELTVKYQGLPLFYKDRPKIQDHWLEVAQKNLMDHEIIWTQEILLEHVTKYLSGLLDEASSAMGLFFVELGLPQKLLEMRVNGRQTIAEINRATEKLIALPSKAEFKEKLMKKFFHKYEKRLALLGFNSPAGAVSIILNGEAVNYEIEPEYTKWIQAIMRAWDL